MFTERIAKLTRAARGLFSETQRAQFFETEWKEGDCAYHAVLIGSNRKVYFSIGSHVPGQPAHVFEFDPEVQRIRKLWDTSRLFKPNSSVVQGKIHSPMFEMGEELLICTHTSWYFHDHTNPINGQSQRPYP